MPNKIDGQETSGKSLGHSHASASEMLSNQPSSQLLSDSLRQKVSIARARSKVCQRYDERASRIAPAGEENVTNRRVLDSCCQIDLITKLNICDNILNIWPGIICDKILNIWPGIWPGIYVTRYSTIEPVCVKRSTTVTVISSTTGARRARMTERMTGRTRASSSPTISL